MPKVPLANSKLIFSNVSRSLPRNTSDWTILDILFSIILHQLKNYFRNTSKIFSIYLSVDGSLCGKLPSSLPIIFLDNLRVKPVAF